MTTTQLRILDDAADAIGNLHTRLEELEGLEPDAAAAVALAAELLDRADEILTRTYCEGAVAPDGAEN